MPDNYRMIEYKSMMIDFNFYGTNEFSVQFCGDDFIFKTEEEAKSFIDDIEKEASHVYC